MEGKNHELAFIVDIQPNLTLCIRRTNYAYSLLILNPIDQAQRKLERIWCKTSFLLYSRPQSLISKNACSSSRHDINTTAFHSLSVTSLSRNITPCFSELITVSISKCMKCQMPPCHPNRRQGEHALHFCAVCLGGLWCKLYFTLAFLFPIFYSKQKIVPNSLLLEGGNLWLLAERHKPKI